MITQRPENNFTYLFWSLFVLQAFAFFYIASFSPPINGYEKEIIDVTSQMAPYHSPPLAYWLSAAGHWLLPDFWLGYRLFHVLVYLIGFIGFFKVVNEYLDARTAFYSCCILASSLLISAQIPMATPEGIAAVFICSALLGFFLHLKTNQKKFLWVLYGSLTLGMLTKGLVAILLPLMIMVLFLMFRIKMNKELLDKIKLSKGLLIVFILSLPWFIYTAWKDSEKGILQLLNTIHWQQNHIAISSVQEGKFYFPFIFIILAILPFGFFLPKSFFHSWKIRQKKPLLLLSLLSLLLVLIFYVFSDTFHPHYLLPAIPFTAIIIGYQLSQVSGRPLSKMKLYIGLSGTALLAIIAPLVLYYFLENNIGEGTEWLSVILMLTILPVGTIICFGLWQFKRTDDGMTVLTIIYLLFSLLLLSLGRTHEVLMDVDFIRILIS